MNEMTAGEFFAEPSDITWPSDSHIITLRDGRMLEVSVNRWVIPTPTETFAIDWTRLAFGEGPHLNSIRRWVAHNLRHKSVTVAAKGYWNCLTLFNTPAFIAATQDKAEIPYLAFSQAIQQLESKNRWQMAHARDYYTWCHSQQFPFFTDDVVRKLDALVIGGNAKGEAVRSADPDKGPLDAMEVAAITSALRAARVDGSMPINEQAALWLCLGFGANASQYAVMREEDVVPEMINGQIVTTLVSVPRHKKRHVNPRTEFQVRKANRFVGRVLRDLIHENERQHPCRDSNEARPLFRRNEARKVEKGLEEWEWHLRAAEFTKLVKRAIKRLRVLSRSGDPLKINTRRLRYSLATRMVEAGASKWALAAALDHTDLQNVDVYFDIDSGIVEQLDAAMAMVLGERAQRFASIVEKEEDAVNGERAGSRRYYADPDKKLFEPIGTCGHTSFCNVNAPYACYLCPKFQAWIDGPHDLVLDALIDNRTRREEMGLDPKMVAVEDELIAHVAEIITGIAAMKEERGLDYDQYR
ncbi:hypothetical protein M3P36_04915 [Altererythrobacter sp. KTW20L]|uniref:hypothetical protein n=1 Tax=Altererythrobacter sp. KTW20L TaxID=2942210 RepID=UPI0020BD64DA|nr:hypothetical protein [Altererythrobacter sp. KTW20L]MCL6250390.1 hypothetical protein [Altererythrobacter sp. KTW20L]